MLTSLRKRLQKDEDGFTLIELMVVVLIIAILIAIAIPTFLGAQDRARDRGAQSNLRNSLTAAKTLATDNAGYFFGPDGTTVIDDIAMDVAEPSLDHAAASDPDDSKVIGVFTDGTAENIYLESVSASGNVFGITANKDGAVLYCRSDDGAVGDCQGATATWVDKW